MREIERKFAVRSMPDLAGINPIAHERYYLRIDLGFEERIQKKGDRYEHEIKHAVSDLARTKEVEEISENEFYALKRSASRSIVPESYKISNAPDISIKIYHGDHEDLIRAEVEFRSEDEARNFTPPDWMGIEITDMAIGKDSTLLQLDPTLFREALELLNIS